MYWLQWHQSKVQEKAFGKVRYNLEDGWTKDRPVGLVGPWQDLSIIIFFLGCKWNIAWTT